jgi:hypothetical protein
MTSKTRYPQELRERAAMGSSGAKFGITRETLCRWGLRSGSWNGRIVSCGVGLNR